MKTWLQVPLACAACAAAAPWGYGCSGGGEKPLHEGADAAVSDAGDAGDAGADGGDGGAPAAYVRVAHWSPDAPTVDVCFAPGGGNFEGSLPQLGMLGASVPPPQDAAADGGGDGGSPGLSFRQLTSYLPLPPGSYGVRLVPAGAPDCSTAVAGLDGVALTAGAHTTIAAVGERMPTGNDQALRLVALPDDTSAPPGQIALRFINADATAGASSVDFGTGALSGNGGTYAALASGVPFGAPAGAGGSDAAPIDSHGYELGLALDGATLSAHVTAAASDLATATNRVTVPAGSAASVVLLGGGSTKANLVLCDDSGEGAAVQVVPCASISP